MEHGDTSSLFASSYPPTTVGQENRPTEPPPYEQTGYYSAPESRSSKNNTDGASDISPPFPMSPPGSPRKNTTKPQHSQSNHTNSTSTKSTLENPTSPSFDNTVGTQTTVTSTNTDTSTTTTTTSSIDSSASVSTSTSDTTPPTSNQIINRQRLEKTNASFEHPSPSNESSEFSIETITGIQRAFKQQYTATNPQSNQAQKPLISEVLDTANRAFALVARLTTELSTTAAQLQEKEAELALKKEKNQELQNEITQLEATIQDLTQQLAATTKELTLLKETTKQPEMPVPPQFTDQHTQAILDSFTHYDLANTTPENKTPAEKTHALARCLTLHYFNENHFPKKKENDSSQVALYLYQGVISDFYTITAQIYITALLAQESQNNTLNSPKKHDREFDSNPPSAKDFANLILLNLPESDPQNTQHNNTLIPEDSKNRIYFREYLKIILATAIKAFKDLPSERANDGEEHLRFSNLIAQTLDNAPEPVRKFYNNCVYALNPTDTTNSGNSLYDIMYSLTPGLKDRATSIYKYEKITLHYGIMMALLPNHLKHYLKRVTGEENKQRSKAKKTTEEPGKTIANLYSRLGKKSPELQEEYFIILINIFIFLENQNQGTDKEYTAKLLEDIIRAIITTPSVNSSQVTSNFLQIFTQQSKHEKITYCTPFLKSIADNKPTSEKPSGTTYPKIFARLFWELHPPDKPIAPNTQTTELETLLGQALPKAPSIDTLGQNHSRASSSSSSSSNSGSFSTLFSNSNDRKQQTNSANGSELDNHNGIARLIPYLSSITNQSAKTIEQLRQAVISFDSIVIKTDPSGYDIEDRLRLLTTIACKHQQLEKRLGVCLAISDILLSGNNYQYLRTMVNPESIFAELFFLLNPADSLNPEDQAKRNNILFKLIKAEIEKNQLPYQRKEAIGQYKLKSLMRHPNGESRDNAKIAFNKLMTKYNNSHDVQHQIDIPAVNTWVNNTGATQLRSDNTEPPLTLSEEHTERPRPNITSTTAHSGNSSTKGTSSKSPMRAIFGNHD